MSDITKEQLDEIIEKHKKWLLDEEGGTRAVLTGADLRGAVLTDADLRGADLRGAVLRGAVLRGAVLTRAVLRGAVLRGAVLTDARNIPYIPMSCPDYGSFIGWKKASQHIVKLQIPDTALRSSATGRKCRCNEAIVLAIENYDGTASELTEIASNYDKDFIYKVGATVKVDNFDENRFNECAPGIHYRANVLKHFSSATRVICVETGAEYETVSEAARETKINRGNIQRCIKDGRRAGGFHWKKVEVV